MKKSHQPRLPMLFQLTTALVRAKQAHKPHFKWVGGWRPGRDNRSEKTKRNVPITLAGKLPQENRNE